MSHRVTTQTEIKDRAIALQALKSANISYREVGTDQIQFTSGKMSNATLNLKTGDITGDTDYGHSQESLGLLRQHYGEAKYRAEALKNGVSIEGRTVDKNGDVILMWSVG